MALPAVAWAPGAGDHGAAQGWEWGHGGRASRPNPYEAPDCQETDYPQERISCFFSARLVPAQSASSNVL